MSTRKRKSSGKATVARRVSKKEDPVVVPAVVKPAAEVKTVHDTEVKAAPAVEVKAIPYTELKVEPEYLRAQIEGIDSQLKIIGDKITPVDLRSIDSQLKIIGDKITPVDLKNIEDKMVFSLDRVNEISARANDISKSLANVEKELQNLRLRAEIFLALGAAASLMILYYVVKMTRIF